MSRFLTALKLQLLAWLGGLVLVTEGVMVILSFGFAGFGWSSQYYDWIVAYFRKRHPEFVRFLEEGEYKRGNDG
jgi:hypothetical protein